MNKLTMNTTIPKIAFTMVPYNNNFYTVNFLHKNQEKIFIFPFENVPHSIEVRRIFHITIEETFECKGNFYNLG